MQVKKISEILSKSEVKRLRMVLNNEFEKSKNEKYYATLLMYVQDLEDISFHKHYSSLLWFIRYYRTSMDIRIKNKLNEAYKNRTFNIDEYQENIRQKFYRYTKKDYPAFLKRSEYFFSIYKKPFDMKNKENEAYLNRAYLGLGFEFLLKAIFLKKGYLINRIKQAESKLKHTIKLGADRIKDVDSKTYELGYNIDLLPEKITIKRPIKLSAVRIKDMDRKTYEFGHLIDLLPKLKPNKITVNDFNYYIMAGLFLCQSWRNQDIHTPRGSSSIDNAQVDYINSARHFLYELYLPRVQYPKN